VLDGVRLMECGRWSEADGVWLMACG